MMKQIMIPAFAGLCSLAAFLPAGQANAQAGAFPVHQMDFDIWCQEEKHLPYERCAKREPQDLKDFDAYRHVIEKYETKDILSKRHTLSVQNIRNAADSDNPKSNDTPNEK